MQTQQPPLEREAARNELLLRECTNSLNTLIFILCFWDTLLGVGGVVGRVFSILLLLSFCAASVLGWISVREQCRKEEIYLPRPSLWFDLVFAVACLVAGVFFVAGGWWLGLFFLGKGVLHCVLIAILRRRKRLPAERVAEQPRSSKAWWLSETGRE